MHLRESARFSITLIGGVDLKKTLFKILGATLIASVVMIPPSWPADAASASVMQPWDKAQEHVELYQIWFADRAENGLIPVRQKQKWGFINYQGKFVLKPQYQLAREPFYQGVAVVNKNQLINRAGKVAFQDKNIEYIGSFNDGLAIAKKKGKIGFMNTKGTFVIAPSYEEGTGFYNQVAFVKKDGKWALIDTNGKTLTPFNIEAKEFGPTYGKFGLYPVKIDGLWGCIDNKGKMVIPAEFESKVEFTDSDIEFGLYKDSHSAIIQKDGSIIHLDKNYRAFGEPQAGLWKVQWGGEGIIDVTGHVVVEPQDEQKIILSGDGSYAVKEMSEKDIGWKYYNKNQTALSDTYFADAKAFSEGLAAVKLDQKWGYITKQGQIKVPNQYEEANLFLGGSAVIRKGGKYGLIGQKGEMIVPAKYDEMVPLVQHDGFINSSSEKVTTLNPLYRVKLNNNVGILDSRGKIVMDVKYPDLYLDYVEYFHDIGPIATVWYTVNAKGDMISTSIDIQKGKRIFPQYSSVYYLGDGMYSGFPLANPSKYAIFNANGKTVFSSGIDG